MVRPTFSQPPHPTVLKYIMSLCIWGDLHSFDEMYIYFWSHTGEIFSLKIRIDSCYWGLPWDHWAQNKFYSNHGKRK